VYKSCLSLTVGLDVETRDQEIRFVFGAAEPSTHQIGFILVPDMLVEYDEVFAITLTASNTRFLALDQAMINISIINQDGMYTLTVCTRVKTIILCTCTRLCTSFNFMCN